MKLLVFLHFLSFDGSERESARSVLLMLSFVLTRFQQYINDLPDDIYNIAFYADGITLYFNSDQSSYLGQQFEWVLNLNTTFETRDWGRTWLINFDAEKTQFALFERRNNYRFTIVRALGRNSAFEMLWLSFTLKLDLCFFIVLIAKTALKKTGGLVNSLYVVSFLSISSV